MFDAIKPCHNEHVHEALCILIAIHECVEWEPLGHSRTSPIVLRSLRGMGTLRALKDIPDCPKAVAWRGSP